MSALGSGVISRDDRASRPKPTNVPVYSKILRVRDFVGKFAPRRATAPHDIRLAFAGARNLCAALIHALLCRRVLRQNAVFGGDRFMPANKKHAMFPEHKDTADAAFDEVRIYIAIHEFRRRIGSIARKCQAVVGSRRASARSPTEIVHTKISALRIDKHVRRLQVLMRNHLAMNLPEPKADIPKRSHLTTQY